MAIFNSSANIDPFILEVKGVQYQGLLNGSASISMESLSNEFTCDVSYPQSGTFPIKRGDECRILIYGNAIITGFVNKIDTHFDYQSHSISISGRDKTCDVIDNTLPAKLNFSTPISIIDITKKVLSLYGLNNINVTVEVDNLSIFSANDVIAAEVGETVFDFLEKYAKKRQVILTTDGSGNIVYTRAHDDVVRDFININVNANKNGVLSVDMSVDDSKRFNKYILISQTNSSASGVVTDFNQLKQPPVESETYTTATSTDSEIRVVRIFNFISDTTHEDQQSRQDRADWEKNVRKANGFSYSLIMQGFKNTNGEIWRPNMLLNVNDSVNDVYANLLILSTEFIMDLDGGTKTKLVLTTPDAFKVQTQKKTKKDKKSKKIADDYQEQESEDNSDIENDTEGEN
jgi:prophage tail gpP-like protein